MFSRVRSIVVMLIFVACGGGGEEAGSSEEGGATGDAAAVDPAQAATITGVVSYNGAVQSENIDMSAEPDCAQKHSGTPTRKVVDVNNGKLRNAYVYVKAGLPQRSWPRASETPVLDQDGCEYKPHIVAVRSGQDFIIRNSDGLLHNINAKPQTNRGFNVGQPTKMDSKKQFSQAEVMIPVTCEVHGWMQAYIGVQDHPYYAVTNEDGTFTIAGLPPGTYTLESWHEKLGTKTMEVTVAAQETKQADISYSGSTAMARVPLGRSFDPHAHHARN